MAKRGQSYIAMSGERVASLAKASIDAIRACRAQRMEKLHREACAQERARWGYRFDRWFERVFWRKATEPTDEEILHDLRSIRGWSCFGWDEECIDAYASNNEETARNLLRLATEAGPSGTVHVTAADLAMLWGYSAPAREAKAA